MRVNFYIEDEYVKFIRGRLGKYETLSSYIRNTLLERMKSDGFGATAQESSAVVPMSKKTVTMPKPIDRTRLSTPCTACVMGNHDICWQIKDDCICPCGCVKT